MARLTSVVVAIVGGLALPGPSAAADCTRQLAVACPSQAAAVCASLPNGGLLPPGASDAEIDHLRERQVLDKQYASALELLATQLQAELARATPSFVRIGALAAASAELFGWSADRHTAERPALECALAAYERAPDQRLESSAIMLAAQIAQQLGSPAGRSVLPRLEAWRNALPNPVPQEMAEPVAYVLGVEASLRSTEVSEVSEVIALRRAAVREAGRAHEGTPGSRRLKRAHAIAMDNLAVALLANTDSASLAEAERLTRAALRMKLDEAEPGHDTVATSLATLGRIQLRRPESVEQGLSNFRRAVITLWGGNDEVTADGLFVMSRVAALSAELAEQLEARGRDEDLVEAIVFYRLSVDARQRMRQGAATLPFDKREAYTRLLVGPYERLAALLFSRGRHAEANAVALLLQGAQIGEVTRQATAGAPARPPVESDYLRRLLEDVRKSRQGDPARAGESDILIGQVRRELLVVTDGQAANVNDINRELLNAMSLLAQEGQHAAAITWLPLASSTIAWVTTADAVQAFRLEIGQQQIDGLAQELQQQIRAKSHEYSQPARELHAKLLDDVIAWLNSRPGRPRPVLVLVPTGGLRTIPFAALLGADNKPLVEKFQLSYVVAGSVGQLSRTPVPSWRVAAFGSAESPPQSGLPALTYVKNELHDITRDEVAGSTGIVAGRIFFDPTFLPDTLQSVLQGRAGLADTPNVVHVASHFLLDANNWPESYLATSGGRRFKVGWITDTTVLPLTRFDLIALSACGTEVGNDARKPQTIGSALLERGTTSVLGTLWNVNDPAAARLMKAFYAARGERRTESKAAALQAAQNDLRLAPATQHPYYWAPYILMGGFR